MAKPHTTWVDLTDIIDWQGHFTGIQRVVYNVAERYAADPNVRFFVLRTSLVKVAFEEVSFDSVRVVKAEASAPSTPAAKAANSALSMRHAKLLARKVAGRIPYARQLVRHARRRTSTQSPKRAIEGPFATGDTVIVLGGNWSDPDYIPAIQTLRARNHFRFYHVVYDLVPTVCPGYVPPEVTGLFNNYLTEVCKASDGLIAISESTRRDLIKFQKDLGMKPLPVAVMRLGDDSAKAETNEPGESPNPRLKPGEFILCVSTVEIRKNHTLLYYAAQLARERNVNLPPIVLVGKLGWLAGDIQFIMQHDLYAQEHIIIQKAVTDSELEWLYRNCSFTIYPSFYEGWGLPIAESLRYGKPCLSSNTSSMPEVGGDLVDYFSPYDPAGCLDQIIRYLDKDLLHRKAQAIQSSYHPRTWGDAFEDVQRFVTAKQD